MKLHRFATCLSVGGCLALGGTAFASPGTLDPELAARMRTARAGEFAEVVLYLSNQPGYEISQRFRPEFERDIELLADQLRAIQVLRRPDGPLTKAQEAEFSARLRAMPPSPPEVAIAQQIDHLMNRFVAAVSRELTVACEPSQRALADDVRELGGQVTGSFTVVNGLVARVPMRRLLELSRNERIANIFPNRPNGAELNTSVATVGGPAFWGAGFTGGAFDAGVLDVSAVQQALPGFAGHRFESNIGAVDANGHPTNCAGIMASVDATYRGVAYGLDSIASSQVNGTAVMMTNMNWMVTQTTERPENINYSITDGTVNTVDYENVDKFFDAVCDTFSLIVSKSTGNQGFGSGAPTITRPAPAYNLLACASLHDFANTNRADDRISSYSSRGPTPAGRKKPDIGAPGENITTLSRSGGVTTGSGTSFSAPHVGGAILLLLHRGVTSTMAAKSILIQTADAMNDFDTAVTTDDVYVQGSFWNRRYGWGYMNLNSALLHAADYFTGSIPAPPAGGRNFKLYKGSMLNKDKATLVWNRHVGYNGANFPTIVRNLSDLNLFAYNRADNALMGSSASTIDNVEQLHVNANANVVLKVATNGSFDPAVPNEAFALATEEGFAQALGITLQGKVLQQFDPLPGSVTTVYLNVYNFGDVPAFNTSVTFTSQPVVGGPASVALGTMQPGELRVVSYNIQTPATSGAYPMNADVVSSSYGETWTGNCIGTLLID